MLSRLIGALWHRKSASTTSLPHRIVTRTPWASHPHAMVANTPDESKPTRAPPPTQNEVQRDLSRVFLAYSTVNDQHRMLFGRYLALPTQLRDKVCANVMGTMDSLESIAESLMLADFMLNAQQVYGEYPVKTPDGEELRETQLEIQEAAEDMQYLTSRVDRIGLTIERLEAENTDCQVLQHSQVDMNAGQKRQSC